MRDKQTNRKKKKKDRREERMGTGAGEGCRKYQHKRFEPYSHNNKKLNHRLLIEIVVVGKKKRQQNDTHTRTQS